MIKNFGRHRVRHGNVMERGGIDQLMAGEGAAIMYSDPPWGDGNLKYWATMNKKMNGAVMEQPPLDEFLTNIFDIADDYVEHFLCIEYGCRWAEMIQEEAMRRKFNPLAIIDVMYRSGSKMLPLHLHVFNRSTLTLTPDYVMTVTGTHGYDCIKKAVEPLAEVVKTKDSDASILDPCCGMGYTAQCAVDFGLSFRGNELNYKRLTKTMKRLEKDA